MSEVLWRLPSPWLHVGNTHTHTHTRLIKSVSPSLSVTKLECLLYICGEKKTQPAPRNSRCHCSSNFMQLREKIQTLSTASINSREAEDSMVGNSHMMAGNSERGERGGDAGVSDILETQHQLYSSLLITSHNCRRRCRCCNVIGTRCFIVISFCRRVNHSAHFPLWLAETMCAKRRTTLLYW